MMSTKTEDFNWVRSVGRHRADFPTFAESATARTKSSFSFREFIGRLLRTYMVARIAANLVAVLLITGFFHYGPAVNATTVGFTYLLAILVASTLFELPTLIVMCIAATMAYDFYFLPPVGTLNISDPQDWVALCAFLVTAVIGCRISTSERNQAKAADRRRLEAERLYTLSSSLLGAKNPVDVIETIPGHIAASFALESAALYFSATQRTFGSSDLPAREIPQLRAAAALGHLQIAADRNVCFAPIRSGESVAGSIALCGPTPASETLEAVAAIVALAIERADAIQRVAKIEAMRESERLKSVLLDAITHDFRTPLTSIKVSVTGLLDDLEFNREQRKELLTIIDEECDRINHLVGEASEMARLESHEVKLELGSHPVGEFIPSAIEDCSDVTPIREIRLDVKHQDSRLLVDLSLAKKVLVHLITNAHLYSAPGQPITIATEQRGGFLTISVADKGPGIEDTEIDHIFEKFYRGKNQRYRVKGTGMGLPIAKAIVETHGGTINAVSRIGQGSIFTFSLPVE
jgi:two-component system sensor histidine kinase KdpD